MGTKFPEITDRLKAFIEAQHLFFVGTAARDGRVNISPKGLDSLRVLGPNRVVWLNGTGSGNETAAHLLDVPRMTVMFCSFGPKPLILRLYGTARAIHEGDADWEELLAVFPPMQGSRNIFDLDVDLVQSSCGFGVPLMDFRSERETMSQWAAKKGDIGVAAYQQEKNRVSLDGLPTGLPEGRARRMAEQAASATS
ncbi:MAG TPA: pyridoxamine 5'-phosphate oxidase family protein [Arachnia sp.]|nr:pyridoxamine 5'-phosphate oxidase family protein [Arachnia sp.]HMT84818.1 pyridoxamine 5'-phosphate oxidase family protein [Arachnia sp.]